MKIEFIDKKIIIYLYKIKLNFNNLEELNSNIKSIFIKLIKKYQLDFFGFSKVTIYENSKYGSILEIEKIYDSFKIDIIDLKLIVHKNSKFYFEFDDYPFIKLNNNFFIKNDKYYLNLDDVDNLYDYLEFGKIVYEK